MIADILPAGAVAAESFGPPGDRNLLPAEAAVVVTADPARRAEFAAGRAVAHAALVRLSAPAGPVLPGRASEGGRTSPVPPGGRGLIASWPQASGAYGHATVVWFVLLGRPRKWGTRHRNPQPEGRATTGKVFHRYGAAMRLHDRLDDRETHAGAAP